jgi:chromosome segregation ATPase
VVARNKEVADLNEQLVSFANETADLKATLVSYENQASEYVATANKKFAESDAKFNASVKLNNKEISQLKALHRTEKEQMQATINCLTKEKSQQATTIQEIRNLNASLQAERFNGPVDETLRHQEDRHKSEIKTVMKEAFQYKRDEVSSANSRVWVAEQKINGMQKEIDGLKTELNAARCEAAITQSKADAAKEYMDREEKRMDQERTKFNRERVYHAEVRSIAHWAAAITGIEIEEDDFTSAQNYIVAAAKKILELKKINLDIGEALGVDASTARRIIGNYDGSGEIGIMRKMMSKLWIT